MKVLVTGAGGFIGRSVVSELLKKGHTVTAFVRSPRHIAYEHTALAWHLGDVRNSSDLGASLRGIDFVVHLAAMKSDEKESFDTNVLGARNLVEACKVSRVRGIVNISTISTKFGRKGVYGETKNLADEVFHKSKIPVITLKPSIVYGDARSGIFGTLIKSTRLPFVPVIGPGTFTSRPIHVQDVARSVEKIISRPLFVSAIYDLGGPNLISFNNLIRLIARKVNGRRVRLVHVPMVFGFIAARIFKSFLKKPPLTLSNVTAMDQDASVDAEDFWMAYDFFPRNLEQGLDGISAMGQGKSSEAKILLEYIFPKTKASRYQIELYESSVRKYASPHHRISPWILRHLIFLGALDAVTRFLKPEGDLQKKLFIAATIVECSPASSTELLPKTTGRLKAFVQLLALGLRTLLKLSLGICLVCIPSLLKNNA